MKYTLTLLLLLGGGCAADVAAHDVDSSALELISCEYGDEAVKRYLRTEYGCSMDGARAVGCYDDVATFEVVILPSEDGQPGNYTLLKSAPCPAGAPVCDGRLRWKHAACSCWSRSECDVTPIYGSVGSD